MRQKRWMALALAGGLLLGGCAGPTPELTPTPAPVPTATPAKTEPLGVGFALPCYPEAGFHPITGTNRLNLTLVPLLYRGLFSLGRDFRPKGELCASYDVSPDGLTWTFHLTHARFSDGTALTAEDVVASLDTARHSERYKGRLADLERIVAEGETVVVTLRRPNGALPTLLEIPIVKEGEDPGRPLGTGAYVLAEDEEGLRLVAREGTETPLPTIALWTVEAGDDLIYAFDAGEISLVNVDLTGTNALGYSGRLETTDYPTTTLLYIGCNTAKGPCRDQRVRQAVALTLDRNDVVETCLAGHAVASALPVHPAAPGYDSSLAKTWGKAPERAKTILEEDGWEKNEEGTLFRRRETLELRMVVNQDNAFKTAAAEAVAGDLRELGFSVTLDKLAWEEYMAVLERGDFDLYLGETALTPDFDLEPLLGRGGALNYTGFADEESWEWMERYRRTQGEERETTLVNLCGRVAELAPIVPLCFKNGSLLTQWGQVTGVTPTQWDVFAGLENWTIRNF